MAEAEERRKFWRATFSAPVKLVTDTAAFDAKLDDISLKGALLEMPVGWHADAGERCTLHLRLGGERNEEIEMWGRVVHLEEDGKLGLVCESIDLDSITHLRRLVELNSGDPNLLERDLSALIGA